MARLPRIVVPQYPHHVIQRGNRRMDVFFREDDRRAYLDYLGEACRKHGVEIWAYCLMSNHVHFIAVPSAEDSLARCFSEAHVRYTRRINLREGWKGHLWQGRFGSSVLDQNYLIAAVRYVERNPVRAGIVANAWEYPWSSAAFHVGASSEAGIVSSDTMLRDLVGDWRAYLKMEDQKTFVESVHRDASVSRPLGDEKFINDLERKYQMKMTRGRAGRPASGSVSARSK